MLCCMRAETESEKSDHLPPLAAHAGTANC
jgi:hypothetical protein